MGAENPQIYGINTSQSISDPGNQRGNEIEQKIARLIGNQPYVKKITITEKDDFDDRQKRDLIVRLSDCDPSIDVIIVYVQAKASNRGLEHFMHNLRKQLKKQGISDQIDIKKWMLEKKLILLNGDLVKKSGKTGRHLTDNEILTVYNAQLSEIIEYFKN